MLSSLAQFTRPHTIIATTIQAVTLFLIAGVTLEEIRVILEHLEAQDKALLEIYQLLTQQPQNHNGS